eukprot:GEMP01035319.1.p1 GENE.GEMP01035319.1~~GEMP01035319.1.p1  ORF type:complete len:418 (+),score=60.66 GEMP01035319.1:131-1384(+)
MADTLTLTNIARAQYVQFFGLGALLFSGRANLFYEHFLHHAPPEAGLEPIVTAFFGATFCAIGAIFVAVALYNDVAAQRKVIQYAMGGYGLLAATQIIENKEHFEALFAFCSLNLVLCIAGVYFLHNEHKLTRGEGTNCALKTSLRVTYVVIILGSTIQYFDLFPSLQQFLFKDPISFTANHYFFKLLCALRSILALALIGAAQLNDADMKKAVQYLILVPLGAIALMIAHNDVLTTRSGNLAILHILLLTLFTYACYPATCAKTTLRFFYFCYFSSAYHCLTETNHFFEVEMPWLGSAGSEAMGKVLGFQLLTIGLFYLVAAQCDADVHEKFLQFATAGHIAVSVGSFYFLNVVNHCTIQAAILVIAVLYHKTLGLDKICESICKKSSEAQPQTSPKRSAGKRSATPVSGGKKKKK